MCAVLSELRGKEERQWRGTRRKTNDFKSYLITYLCSLEFSLFCKYKRHNGSRDRNNAWAGRLSPHIHSLSLMGLNQVQYIRLPRVIIASCLVIFWLIFNVTHFDFLCIHMCHLLWVRGKAPSGSGESVTVALHYPDKLTQLNKASWWELLKSLVIRGEILDCGNITHSCDPWMYLLSLYCHSILDYGCRNILMAW